MSDQDNEKPLSLPEVKSGASPVSEEPSPSSQKSEKVTKKSVEDEICRKYIWGTCDKPTLLCRFKHIRDIDLMKKLLKFCHDNQNQGCNRPTCSYLHTTREEENLFLNYDQIPKVLLDRYAALEERVQNHEALAVAGFSPGVVKGPALAGSIAQRKDAIVVHPTGNVGSPSITTFPPQQPPPLRGVAPAPLQQPLQPNNVPLDQPAVTSHSHQNNTSPSVYNSPPVLPASFTSGSSHVRFPRPQVPINAVRPPLPLPVNFDSSRPPPPPPPRLQLPPRNSPSPIKASQDSSKIPHKRPRNNDTNHSETDATDGDEEFCTECLQREIGISDANTQIEKLLRTEGERELIYQQMLEDYNRVKKILLSIIGSEYRNRIEDFIDGVPEVAGNWIEQHQTPKKSKPDGKAMTTKMLYQMLEALVTAGKNKNLPSQRGTSFELPSYVQQGLTQPIRMSTSPTQSPQVEDMAYAIQQLITHCGQILVQNEIEGNKASPTAPGPSGIKAPKANHVLEKSTTTQKRTPDKAQRTPSKVPSIQAADDAKNPTYDPNLPPPSMKFVQHLNQPNASSRSPGQNAHIPHNNMVGPQAQPMPSPKSTPTTHVRSPVPLSQPSASTQQQPYSPGSNYYHNYSPYK